MVNVGRGGGLVVCTGPEPEFDSEISFYAFLHRFNQFFSKDDLSKVSQSPNNGKIIQTNILVKLQNKVNSKL